MSETKIFRIVAIVITEFYGTDAKNAVINMKAQAETMGDEDWIILAVKDVSKT
jgi:hypothetical protein